MDISAPSAATGHSLAVSAAAVAGYAAHLVTRTYVEHKTRDALVKERATVKHLNDEVRELRTKIIHLEKDPAAGGSTGVLKL